MQFFHYAAESYEVLKTRFVRETYTKEDLATLESQAKLWDR